MVEQVLLEWFSANAQLFRLSHRGGLVIHIELRLTMYWCNIEAEGPPMVATISLHCAHNGGTAWVQCVGSIDSIHNVGNPSINNHCQPYLTDMGGEFTQKDLSSNLPTIQSFQYIFFRPWLRGVGTRCFDF